MFPVALLLLVIVAAVMTGVLFALAALLFFRVRFSFFFLSALAPPVLGVLGTGAPAGEPPAEPSCWPERLPGGIRGLGLLTCCVPGGPIPFCIRLPIGGLCIACPGVGAPPYPC